MAATGNRQHDMKKLPLVFAILAAVVFAPLGGSAFAATLTANVSLSTQTMTVIHRGRVIAHWPVSTARRGKITPTGSWSAKWLSRNHRSSRYNNAPMPYSIFYNGNYAVHGTYDTKRLGRPASSGCVRLAPANAAKLFALAKAEGLNNTRINVRY